MHRVFALVLLIALPAAAATPARKLEPPPQYYVQLWAEQPDGTKVWEIASAAAASERFAVSDGNIVGRVQPGKGTMQDLQTGLQITGIVHPKGEHFQAQISWSYDVETSPSNRRSRNHTCTINGTPGKMVQLGQVAATKDQAWTIKLLVQQH